MGRGLALPINFSDDGPRPGLALHFFSILGLAGPGPTRLQFFRPGPAGLSPSHFEKSRPGLTVFRPVRPISAWPVPSAHDKPWRFSELTGQVGSGQAGPKPTRSARSGG